MARHGECKVFVYGTLKRGYNRNGILSRSSAEYLGDATLHGAHKLFDLGAFPGLVRDASFPQSEVHGEVWKITPEVLSYLDAVEGHPNFYSRYKVKTLHGKAWVYGLPKEYVANCRPLESGRWPEKVKTDEVA